SVSFSIIVNVSSFIKSTNTNKIPSTNIIANKCFVTFFFISFHPPFAEKERQQLLLLCTSNLKIIIYDYFTNYGNIYLKQLPSQLTQRLFPLYDYYFQCDKHHY